MYPKNVADNQDGDDISVSEVKAKLDFVNKSKDLDQTELGYLKEQGVSKRRRKHHRRAKSDHHRVSVTVLHCHAVTVLRCHSVT